MIIYRASNRLKNISYIIIPKKGHVTMYKLSYNIFNFTFKEMLFEPYIKWKVSDVKAIFRKGWQTREIIGDAH